ncbi:hypothetical protein GCM10023320_01180 [Pseudonocardia adelaidensis]|uniref:Uncharacterized protein n=1 Tax=Pseudonocardia adelaidensis TaxID=648754 RepID=A0ABP9N5W5_9PSEU
MEIALRFPCSEESAGRCVRSQRLPAPTLGSALGDLRALVRVLVRLDIGGPVFGLVVTARITRTR